MLRLYDDLMREQPSGEHGNEVNPQTAEPLKTCRCRQCADAETKTTEGPTPRKEAEQ